MTDFQNYRTLFLNNFVYFWLCWLAFCSWGEQGPLLFVAMLELLAVSCFGAQALGAWASIHSTQAQ